MLGNPPVVFLLKVADREQSCCRTDCELILLRRPLDASGCAVDTKEYKSGTPLASIAWSPDVSITVGRASYDLVGIGGPVDTHHFQIMFHQLVGFFPVVPFLFVDVDFVVVG